MLFPQVWKVQKQPGEPTAPCRSSRLEIQYIKIQPGFGYFSFTVLFKVNRRNRIYAQTICDHVWTAVIGTKSRWRSEAFQRPQQMLETHLAFRTVKEADFALKGKTGVEKSSRDVLFVVTPKNSRLWIQGSEKKMKKMLLLVSFFGLTDRHAG